MDRRREIAGRLGAVLLVVVVIAVLVGMLEGNGFAEGDTGKQEEGQVEGVEKGRRTEVERGVDLGVKVVLGVWGAVMSWAMLRVMREQSRVEERRDRERRWERRYRVVEGLLGVVGEVWSGSKLDRTRKMRVVVELVKGRVLGGEVGDWMRGVPDMMDEAEKVEAGLRREGLKEEEKRSLEERQEKVIAWLSEGMVRLLGEWEGDERRR